MKQSLLTPNAAHDFAPLPPRRPETLREKLYRFFFGDDVFISYARADAIRYVPKLAAQLTAEKHICFFDQLVPDPNEDLPQTLKNKILRSTVFVLIGTKGAVSSPFVRKEIELFRSTRRPFIPVDVDGALADQQNWADVIGLAKIHENAANVRDGHPSPEVVNLIKDSFRYTRRSKWLRISLFTGIGLILATVTLSLLLIWIAKDQAASIKTSADLAVNVANQKVHEAEQRLREITDELNRIEREATDARRSADQAVAQQQTAEQAMRRAQKSEHHALKRAADTSRREEGSRAALLSRKPGMEITALKLAVNAAEQSVKDANPLREEVFDGIVASTIAADYSLPLEDAGKWDPVLPVIISPDGDKIVGVFQTTQLVKVVLWDGQTGEIMSESRAGGGMFLSSFSRDGKRFAAVNYAGLELWEVSGTRMGRLATPCGKGIDAASYSVALNTDGTYVIIGGPMDKPFSDVTVCEIATGREEVLPGLRTTLSVAFTPEDEPAVYGTNFDSSATSRRQSLLFPRSGREVMLKLPAATPLPRFMSFANDGSVVSMIVDGETAGRSRIYVEGLDGSAQRFGGYRGVVMSAAYLDGKMRAVSVTGDTFRVVDGRRLPNFAALRGHIRPVEVGAFSPDGRTIVTISDDGKARLWDTQTGRLRHTLAITDEDLLEGPLLVNRPKAAAFRADGRRLVTANDKGEVHTWDVNTGRLVCSASGPRVSPMYPTGVPWAAGGNYVNAVSFHTGSNYVMASYQGSFINFFDAQTCELAGTFHFDKPVWFVEFSSDGARMTTREVTQTPTASNSKSTMESWDLRGLDLRSGRPIRLSPSSLEELPGAMFIRSRDGNLRLTFDDNRLQLWRPGETHPVQLERGDLKSRFHFQAIVSADNARLAAMSDGEVKVWDTRSGQLALAFDDGEVSNWVQLLAVSSDGSKLLMACKDNTARIYPTSRGQFLNVARRLLGEQ